MSGKSKGVISFILFVILLVPAVAFGWNSDNDPEKIINGAVYINDMPIGGMEVKKARKIAESSIKGFPETEVELSYSNKKWVFKFRELGIRTDVEAAVTEARQLGRRGAISQRIKERWKALSKEQRITVPVTIDKEKALKQLKAVAISVGKKAQNARYTYHNHKPEIIPHVYGSELDLEKTLEKLMAAAKKRVDNPDIDLSVSLPVEMIYPEVTAPILKNKAITIVSGDYATNFNTRQVGRSKNIAMAVKYLDGTVVPPGGTFSFNDAVGPRTKGTGFEEALIIVDDQFAPGLGGGVCQVSSTLYNAALRSGMKIKERSRHSKIINYVPIGLDAAVSYGYLDLKFINTTDFYIAICAEVHGGSLNMRILSEKKSPYTIEVRSFIESRVEPRTEIRYDGGIEQGKEYIESPGKAGSVARAERIWYKDGKEVKREVISRDFYPAEAKVIIKGSHKTQVIKPEKKTVNKLRKAKGEETSGESQDIPEKNQENSSNSEIKPTQTQETEIIPDVEEKL